MSFSAFSHDHPCPTDEDLSSTVGAARPLWERGLALLAREFGATGLTWRSYGRISGWSLNVKDSRGTLAYFYPQPGGVIVVVTVGHDAIERARGTGLWGDVAEAIATARPYPKGYSVATDVCAEADLGLVAALCRVKRGVTARAG